MEQHKLGDLLLFRDRVGKKTLGYIQEIITDPYDGNYYKVMWENERYEDITTEMEPAINLFKRNLQEYMLGIKV